MDERVPKAYCKNVSQEFFCAIKINLIFIDRNEPPTCRVIQINYMHSIRSINNNYKSYEHVTQFTHKKNNNIKLQTITQVDVLKTYKKQCHLSLWFNIDDKSNQPIGSAFKALTKISIMSLWLNGCDLFDW